MRHETKLVGDGCSTLLVGIRRKRRSYGQMRERSAEIVPEIRKAKQRIETCSLSMVEIAGIDLRNLGIDEIIWEGSLD